MKIKEIRNDKFPKLTPVKEVMNIIIPDIKDENIPRRNGTIWCLTGSGGSGKTSLLLNFFRDEYLYLCKFHNIFYYCPMTSFLSVEDHPFKSHDKVYHNLTVEALTELYNNLQDIKAERLEKGKKKENQYNCVIIDDMANMLKNKDIESALNMLLIKARHLNTMFIFTLQSYYYFPKILRKQITYLTIFKPKNYEEWESVSKELFNLTKDNALKLFNYVFNTPYNHLDVDTIDNKYYKNFNRLEFEE